MKSKYMFLKKKKWWCIIIIERLKNFSCLDLAKNKFSNRKEVLKWIDVKVYHPYNFVATINYDEFPKENLESLGAPGLFDERLK